MKSESEVAQSCPTLSDSWTAAHQGPWDGNSYYLKIWGFPGGSDGKASARNVGDPGSILGWEDPLEKEMATHSSILAWRIPWTEDPDELHSMGHKESDTLSD